MSRLTLSASPIALRYLRVQAAVLLVTAMLAFAVVLLVLFFHAYPLTVGDGVWMAAIAVLGVGALLGARLSAGLRAPALDLGDDELRVGDETVKLDGTTRLELPEPAPLPAPRRTPKAFFRLPGMVGFPHFDGGPTVLVRTGATQVGFRPILYGPAAFFGAAADPQAAQLVERLIAGRGGDVATWLRATFAPAEVPKVDTSVRVFLISYIVVSTIIVAFLGWLLLYGVARARGF